MASTPNDNANSQHNDSFVQLLMATPEHTETGGERPISASQPEPPPRANRKQKRRASTAKQANSSHPRTRKRDLSALLEDVTTPAGGRRGSAATENTVISTECILADSSGLSGLAGIASGGAESPDNAGTSQTASKKPRRQTARKHHELMSKLYVDKLVAFSAAKESWLKNSVYSEAGSAYIVGRVTRFDKKKALLEIQWIDTQFQKKDEYVGISIVQNGIENYSKIMSSPTKPAWRNLCHVERSEIELEEDASDIEEADGVESCQTYSPEVIFPSTMADVESIENMKFDPEAQMEAPSDLYEHGDRTTETRIRPQYRHIFEHSPSSSFFAYIPVYFWVEVVHQTNKAMREYERANRIAPRPLFSLQEMMTFLGILFYMALVDKGEYANYWGQQIEDRILGGCSVGLDGIMPLARFKLLRKSFCFRVISKPSQPLSATTSRAVSSEDADVQTAEPAPMSGGAVSTDNTGPPISTQQTVNSTVKDAVARIRTLVNLLKITGGKYVDVGRDVALDEASVACRSKFGRRLIMYNPMKPGGKYHFRIYMLCCSTTWIAINFRVHCNSDVSDRLHGVATESEIVELRGELNTLAVVRGQVMEVVRPLYYTNRVINADNYYMSVQLLSALGLKGLYGRGTVRCNSVHFPKHVILKKSECIRGTYRQAVSSAHQITAVSWFDSAVVKMVSNADNSTSTSLTRRVGSTIQPYAAPACVAQYNKNMQGVDRLDQLRGRFSLADGHSFKKWYKKLAMSLIDVARVNAFMSRKLVVDMSKERDPHRAFVTQLACELLTGKWMEAPSDRRMLYTGSSIRSDDADCDTVSSWACGVSAPDISASPLKVCIAQSSKQLFSVSKKRRQCVVCRWENRFPTVVTDHCTLHNVCLCQLVHKVPNKRYYCQTPGWTCWEKFHKFYLPQQLFSAKGNLMKASELFKLKIADPPPPRPKHNKPTASRTLDLQ